MSWPAKYAEESGAHWYALGLPVGFTSVPANPVVPRQPFRITRSDDGKHRGNARYQAELRKKPEPKITRDRQADRLLRINSSPEHVKCAVTRSACLANKICFAPKRRNSCYTQLARARPGVDYAHVLHIFIRDANIKLLLGKKLYNCVLYFDRIFRLAHQLPADRQREQYDN